MKLSILLVDDEEGILTVLSLLLRDMGHRVRTAPGGAEALKLFSDEPPDLVMTDVRMPGMDGIALLKAIKELRPDAEVLILTGHGDMDLAVAGLRHGAGDFLSKPIPDAALEVALDRARQRIALREALRRHTEELEELVRQRTAELIESERFAAVGESAAGTAHAVKNIAGALQGTMFVLEKGLELNKREYFEQGWQMIRQDVVRLKDLAMSLLELGKRRELVFAAVDPDTPAREALETLRARAADAGVTLEGSFEAGPEPFVLAPEAVHQCLLNLMLNAIECFPGAVPGSGDGRSGPAPLVRLRAARKSGSEGGIVYTVTDNGPGLPEAPPEDERGAGGAGFLSTKAAGSGIGLFSTRKTAREMGAELRLSAAPGGGTEAVLIVHVKEGTTAPGGSVANGP